MNRDKNSCNQIGNLRSFELTEGLERAGHRALLHSLGIRSKDFSRPFIAVVNCWNEIVPGCIHLRDVGNAVKNGVRQAGGIPFEFNTIAVCDGIAQGHKGMRYPLVSREIIAASIEIMLEAHQFDGAVFITSCDKITPGMLMAAGRVDIPSIIVCAGTMEAGEFRQLPVTLSRMREFSGQYLVGKLNNQEMQELEEGACPGPGSCAMLGTANTMACLSEVLGMSLPYSATMPATRAEKIREAITAGEKIMDLLERNQCPSSIMTADAFNNALKVTMAIGGSTNSLIHLPAIAAELNININLEDISKISESVPYIVKVNPSGPQPVGKFHKAGGIPAVMKSMQSLLNLETIGVSGINLSQQIQYTPWPDQEFIRPIEKPFGHNGGLAILRGNLAPDGAVIKVSGVDNKMWVFEGKAMVFNNLEDAVKAVKDNRILPGSVIVIRYEGPKGGPGMREMQVITALLVGSELSENTALITDGRFSGSTRGPCIGHITPEAIEGGPIAVVEDGDIISINLYERRLELKLTDEEIKDRLLKWKPLTKESHGVLKLYAKSVDSVAKGAIWRC